MTRATMGTAGELEVEVLGVSEVHVAGQPSPAVNVRLPDGTTRWIPGEWIPQTGPFMSEIYG